jgi:hypothetical protein
MNFERMFRDWLLISAAYLVIWIEFIRHQYVWLMALLLVITAAGAACGHFIWAAPVSGALCGFGAAVVFEVILTLILVFISAGGYDH